MITAFGKLLRKWRLEHDVKATVMAKAVGCSKTYLYSMEEGIRSPSYEMTARLADFMQLSEEERHVMQLCIDQSRKVWMIDMTQFSQEARALLVAFVEGLKKGYGDARD